ncbi:MAG TPA: formylglycine-generating enzyme family protein [Rudaea sp.]|jgi:formylglycine-generating enzyme required for sulfatase activity|uniref:formylglycine-generating enzyme family protein n=1 Tax=Rudaea sp. TaxID=2136325 RepID=UPI002F937D12
MPGSEVVQKQSVLGGIAGIALLLFALVYRFYPNLPSTAPPSPLPRSAANSDNTMLTAQAQQPAPVAPAATPAADDSAAATQWGPPASLAPPPPPPPKAIAALLKKADAAFDRGRLLEIKDGALALYRQALNGDARSAAAKAGVEKVHNAILQQTGDALDRGDENESARLIAALQDFALDDNNVAALQTRLKKLRQTTPLLTRAAELLHQAASEASAGKDQAAALDVYRQIMKIDPGNKLADQGLAQIERGYLDRALGAAAQDDFGGADQTLAAASSIRPGSHELLDTRTRIEGIRRQRATAVMSQANSALDAGNPDLAQLLAQKALGLSPDVAGIDVFNERLHNARLYANYKPGQVISDAFVDRNGKAPPLIVIPTGSFIMGSPAQESGHRSSEEPQREVKISVGFALGRDEVSVAEFRTFIDDANYQTDAEKLGSSIIYDEESGRTLERHGITWRKDYNGESAGDTLPVIHVSWNDAHAYAQWLSTRTGKHYRLPSEAEYEYALRAGSATRFWWGDGNPAKPLANLTGDGDRSPTRHLWANSFPHYSDGYWGPAPIGKFPANPFGLRDIDGNVSDWVEDCWHDSYLRAPADSRAWVNPGCERRVVRGASWGSAPDQARSAFRGSLPADARNAQVGLRVARDL